NAAASSVTSSSSSPSSPITSEAAVIDAIVPPMMSQREKVATTFVTATLASSFSLYYLHRISPGTVNKTIDLTLLALVRAIDVLVRYIYQERIPEHTKQKWIPKWLSDHIDTLAFVCSCSEIMFAWFYAPKRLPSSYIEWIDHMAHIDPRIMATLRLIRNGEIEYGRDTGHSRILSEYAAEVGLDPSMGDPVNGPIPCVLVHGNETRFCEVHAGIKWFRGFLMALKVYLPIHGLPPLVFRTNEVIQKPMDFITHIFTSTSQSASFLATFITAIWYSCCFTRSRIGPILLPWVNKTRWDRLGPLLGCFVCGFSLMLENKRRRSEMALYVAPRALISFWSRLVGENEWWNEANTLKELGEVGLFGFAMGVVVTAMKYRKGIVRPMVRGALSWVLDV
ncbi:13399_t:CDS:2, partial [Ambispora leptoticha]